MEIIRLLGVIIKENRFKCSLLCIIIILSIFAYKYNPHEKLKVNKYIRLSYKTVYVQSDYHEVFLDDKGAHYKDGYAYYTDRTLPTIAIVGILGLLTLFVSLAGSDDDDVNFDFSYCKALIKLKDISIISVGNREFVYLLDKKAILLSNNPFHEPNELHHFIMAYLKFPEKYHNYTSKEDVRMDIINDIIEN